MHTFDLNLKDISKIEGKASLTVKVKDGCIEDLKFAITEYKRFYTQAIRGKDVAALPQLSCRICGTCSNAHLLCSIKAVENALGVIPSQQTKILRRLINFGLIIRDHALHLYVFALPDVFNIDNILDLDENDEYQHQILHDIFIVKQAGNILGKLIGGRSVHAPFPTIGGFIRLPDKNVFPALLKQLTDARPAVLRLIKIFYECDFKLQQKIDFVALTDEKLTFLDGSLKTNSGMVINYNDFGTYLDKIVIPYSHASGYKFIGRTFFVGALARLNLAKESINPRTKKDTEQFLAPFPSNNIYHNNLAQAIEILHALDSSVDILKDLKIAGEKPVSIERKKGVGVSVIEAPRGTLFYKFKIDEDGKIENGDIAVPTGQNQIGIEKSIYHFLKENIDKKKDFLVHEIEKIVRAYDPCMSCASHFLRVKWISK